ncbi:hypothetical protein AB1Y20_020735 [Prymnesium parvum]|uniref:cGMP-dependent protein kinase n=1 Tax=Prymnesium parvum TaxID=97485 RepID=A0AB34JXS3_PRYPA
MPYFQGTDPRRAHPAARGVRDAQEVGAQAARPPSFGNASRGVTFAQQVEVPTPAQPLVALAAAPAENTQAAAVSASPLAAAAAARRVPASTAVVEVGRHRSNSTPPSQGSDEQPAPSFLHAIAGLGAAGAHLSPPPSLRSTDDGGVGKLAPRWSRAASDRRLRPAEALAGRAVQFTPSAGALSAHNREFSREVLATTLRDNFFFNRFTPAQLEDSVRAMRHRFVREGTPVSVQGEKAHSFYVCTRGGFNLTQADSSSSRRASISSQDAPSVKLVAQVGPGGFFGGTALLRDDGEVSRTATAAVDSEIFSLTREAYVRIKLTPPPARGEALKLLIGLPRFSSLPLPTLEAIAGAMQDVSIAPAEEAAGGAADAKPSNGIDDAGDNFLILIAEGEAVLTHARPAESSRSESGRNSSPPCMSPQVSPSEEMVEGRSRHYFSLLTRFSRPPTEPLVRGDIIAAGREGEESFLASLYVDKLAASDGRAARLQLLQGRPEEWELHGAQGAGVRCFRVPLRKVTAQLSEVPSLVARPLNLSSILQCQSIFRRVEPKTLDALSFSFALRIYMPGQTLHTAGQPSDKFHMLLAGRAQLTIQRPNDDGFAVFCQYERGDVISYRSILSDVVEVGTATAMAESLCIMLDRAAARQLLPDSVKKELLCRRDETATFIAVDPENMEVQRIIARGTFGTVASVKDKKTGKLYAVKKILRTVVAERVLQQQLLNEKSALAMVHHPFICDFYGTYKNAQALYLVLELCDGPELYMVLQEQGRLGLEAARLYAACILSALAELHARKWMFRDLKAENVVFAASGAVKLVDFGLAVRVPEGSKLFTVCGSTEYMAPEVVEQSGYDGAADWWSFGCLVYEMYFGTTPWIVDEDGMPNYGLSETEVSERIVDAGRALTFRADVAPPGDALASLISGLLQRKDAIRLGCSNMGSEAIRRHDFFDGIDWEALRADKVAFPPMPVVRHRASSDVVSTELEPADQAVPALLDPVSAQLMKFMMQRAAAATAPSEADAKEEGTDKAGGEDEVKALELIRPAESSETLFGLRCSTGPPVFGSTCHSSRSRVSNTDTPENFWASTEAFGLMETGTWDRDF